MDHIEKNQRNPCNPRFKRLISVGVLVSQRCLRAVESLLSAQSW